jgi:TatD-related deoxyribonuclease
LKLAKLVCEKTSVKVYTSLGPYPVELLRLEEKIGLEKGKGVMLRGMDIAGKFVEEGQAVALGEIGRPHFPVSEKIMEISNEVMKYGMQLATDIGCAVVLHTESASPEVFKELAELADSVGLPRNKVVKHYSPPIVREEDNYGLFPSVLAGEKAVKEALSKGTRFMLETDFLDDPKRPGAVLGIKTVPKRTKALLEEGILSEDDLLAIHKENPESVYNIKMDE